MNKNWIIILAILIVGLFGLYQIVETSTTVGHAVATIDKVVVTLPSGFTNFDSHEKYIGIENRNTNEKIFFTHNKDGNHTDESFENKLAKLDNSWDIEVTKNTTKTVNNITVKTIFYTNTTENQTEYIESFFYEFNTTYSVKTLNFDNATQAEKNIDFIIETLHIDYKQPQD